MSGHSFSVFHHEGQEKKQPASGVHTGLRIVAVFHSQRRQSLSCAVESVTEQGKGDGKGKRRNTVRRPEGGDEGWDLGTGQ